MRFQTALLALISLGSPALAQSAPPGRFGGGQNDTLLNELRTAPVPKQAPDLDTMQLASAQRERAASMEEKTNGLWQSWTMSICEGCGDTPSYKKTVSDNFANKKPRYATGSEGSALRRQALTSRSRTPDKAPHSLYADLSTENISQIRRMPGQ